MASAESALARFSEFAPAVLIADVELPGMNGLDMLSKLGDELKDVPAIIITGKGSEERVINAIEAGAYWYIDKPIKTNILRALLERAVGRVRDRRQVAALTRQLRETGRLGDLIGGSKIMQDVMRLVEQVAPSSDELNLAGTPAAGRFGVRRQPPISRSCSQPPWPTRPASK